MKFDDSIKIFILTVYFFLGGGGLGKEMAQLISSGNQQPPNRSKLTCIYARTRSSIEEVHGSVGRTSFFVFLYILLSTSGYGPVRPSVGDLRRLSESSDNL